MTNKQIEKTLLNHGEMINKSVSWWEREIGSTLNKIETAEKKSIIDPKQNKKIEFLSARLKYLVLKGQFEEKNMQIFQNLLNQFAASNIVKQIIKNAIKKQAKKSNKNK